MAKEITYIKHKDYPRHMFEIIWKHSHGEHIDETTFLVKVPSQLYNEFEKIGKMYTEFHDAMITNIIDCHYEETKTMRPGGALYYAANASHFIELNELDKIVNKLVLEIYSGGTYQGW